MRDPRSQVPGVDVVLASLDSLPPLRHEVVVALVRDAIQDLRREVAAHPPARPAPDRAALVAEATARVRGRLAGLVAPPQRVVNATGVVLHTGLGRAPLSTAAREAVAAAAGAFAVEVDDAGRRGHRDVVLARLVTLLTGCEDATFANNGAGALVLALRAVAGAGRVAVSRGELIEIGGSFRLPDVIAAAGVDLVEVGTTNRTHGEDVRRGVADGVDAVLVVHPSNYRVTGFTATPSLAEVVAIAHEGGAAVVHDVGSGVVSEPGPDGADGEPSVAASIRTGVDLVTGSGDKLLGGPQAGLVVGRHDLVARVRRDPMARTQRLDKLRVAALQATLQDHLAGGRSLPVARMLRVGATTLEVRAQAMHARLSPLGIDVEVVATKSVVGGGSVPGSCLQSVAISLPQDVAAGLGAGSPRVVARVEAGRCLLDLRTVPPDEDEAVVAAVAAVVGAVGSSATGAAGGDARAPVERRAPTP